MQRVDTQSIARLGERVYRPLRCGWLLSYRADAPRRGVLAQLLKYAT
jgi:hypothetical protein